MLEKADGIRVELQDQGVIYAWDVAHRVYTCRSPLVSRISRSLAHDVETIQIFTPGLDLG